MGAVVWAEAPEDDGDAKAEAHDRVDETFASRRLKRWLKGMFGGGPGTEKPPEDEQERWAQLQRDGPQAVSSAGVS